MPTHLPLVFDAPARGRAPKHWLDFDVPERRAAMESFGLPAFRADQISRHVFDGLSDEVSTWTDLPAAIREDLAEQLFPPLLTQVRRLTADQGRTVKTLWRLHDDSLLESVLMRYPNRSTLCISSQAGCGMACPFCATGQGGLKRNLSRAEITIQAFAANRMLAAGEVPGVTGRLNNVVFMGMGEPLLNERNVFESIRALNHPKMRNLGARHITISTSGIVPGIEDLADFDIPLRLSLSLHAPNDELRSRLMPINRKYPLSRLVEALRLYRRRTGERITIEYAMIDGVNDAPQMAYEMAALLDGLDPYINLIPYNPIPMRPALRRSPEGRVKAFCAALSELHIEFEVRKERGADIMAACGQLAAVKAQGPAR